MMNLSTISDAELGRLVRASLTVSRANNAPAARAEAKAILAEIAGEQDRIKGVTGEVLAGFTVGTQDIPTLDMSSAGLDEVAPSKIRSPYNKARYRLGTTELLDQELTWAGLAVEHKRLAKLAAIKAEPKPPIDGRGVINDRGMLAVVLDPEAKAKQHAKVNTLAEVLGITKAQAAKRVAEMSAS